MNQDPRNAIDDSLLPAAAKIVVPLQYAFAIYLLLRGHNLPGGGFIGGLVLASALVLRLMVHPEKIPRLDPVSLVGAGILCAATAATFPFFTGDPFFKAIWFGDIFVPGLGKLKLGTPMLFDTGVFLGVTGVGAKILSVLLSQEQTATRPRKP